jgi:putative SOS response-associated peptidase YedK
MCANYTPSARDQLLEHFRIEPPPEDYAAEAFPGSSAPIIRLPDAASPPGEMEAVNACFGMLPYWADMKLARSTYNARSETVASKPSFRQAWRLGQFCVIPVASFYEPNYESGKAVRWKIALADGRPMGLAGIWESRAGGPGAAPLLSFSMLTINADGDPMMDRFYKPGDEKRSVVILTPDDYESWLHAPLEQAPGFLQRYPAELLSAAPAPLHRAAPRAVREDRPAEPSLF